MRILLPRSEALDEMMEAARRMMTDKMSGTEHWRGWIRKAAEEIYNAGAGHAVEVNEIEAIIGHCWADSQDLSGRPLVVGLNLLRQLVGGKNSLRTLEVFPCNQAEHEDTDCKCFWEQCEAWAKRDVATPAPSDELVDEVQHRMDQVVEAAVEWHQAGREGSEWFDKAEALGAAIDCLLELRSKA